MGVVGLPTKASHTWKYPRMTPALKKDHYKSSSKKPFLFQSGNFLRCHLGICGQIKCCAPLREFIDYSFPSNSTASLQLQSWGCKCLRRMPHQACSSGDASTIRPRSHGHQSYLVSASIQNWFKLFRPFCRQPPKTCSLCSWRAFTLNIVEPCHMVSGFFCWEERTCKQSVPLKASMRSIEIEHIATTSVLTDTNLWLNSKNIEGFFKAESKSCPVFQLSGSWLSNWPFEICAMRPWKASSVPSRCQANPTWRGAQR